MVNNCDFELLRIWGSIATTLTVKWEFTDMVFKCDNGETVTVFGLLIVVLQELKLSIHKYAPF